MPLAELALGRFDALAAGATLAPREEPALAQLLAGVLPAVPVDQRLQELCNSQGGCLGYARDETEDR